MKDILNQMKTSTLVLIEKAAEKGKLNKGTWDGCVFNQAADECGINANSFRSAASIDPLCRDFIMRWDSLRGYTTEHLLVDVRSILDVKGRPTGFQEVDMGRVKGIRRKHVANSTLFTMEDFESSLRELIDA